MFWLKQSASCTINIGPFLDETDGKTPETGLSIAQADIRLSKNGANFAQSAYTGGATHDENGWYYTTLAGTDTGSVGRLVLAVTESGALPVWHEFQVVPANVYASLVGYGGTDTLEVDTIAIGGSTTAANNAETVFSTDFTTNYDAVNNRWTVDTIAVSGSPTPADNLETVFATDFGSNYDSSNDRWKVDVVAISGTTNTADNLEIVYDDDFTDVYDAVNNRFKVDSVAISGSTTAANNAETVFDTDFATNYDTTLDRWTTSVDLVEGGDATDAIRDAVVDDATRIDASALNTLSGHDPGSQLASQSDVTGLNDPTAADIADAVWDELATGHTDAGKAGEQLWTDVDAILADTGTDGVVLANNAITSAKIATDAIGSDEVAAAGANKIADHIIRRSFQNACDSSDGDTKSFRSLLGAVAKLVNKVSGGGGSTLSIYEDDDSTVLGTQTITADSGADPIISLDTD